MRSACWSGTIRLDCIQKGCTNRLTSENLFHSDVVFCERSREDMVERPDKCKGDIDGDRGLGDV
jgi:hypothetical protein